MSNDNQPPPQRGPHYEIRVAGRLTARWSAWFDGLSVAAGPDGTTVISGPVADQAALHGLLHKLRDIGLPLLGLTRLPATTGPAGGPADPNQPNHTNHPNHEESQP